MNIRDATPYDATVLLMASLGYLEVNKPTEVDTSFEKPVTNYGWSEHTLNILHSSAHQPKSGCKLPMIRNVPAAINIRNTDLRTR